ncbi:hypothetical protein [Nonomuraea sp. B5E05]|uniref:hypothetical protein n=1 Tax=Nonomuraea sp. B5E05 TaxID=3153569 RepID=UPI003261CCE7
MYAFIRRYRIGKGTVEALTNRVERQFAGQLTGDAAQAPVRVPDGIVSYQAIDSGDDTVTTVTLFQSEQHWRRASQAATDIRLSLSDFEVEELDTITGPVTISKEAK